MVSAFLRLVGRRQLQPQRCSRVWVQKVTVCGQQVLCCAAAVVALMSVAVRQQKAGVGKDVDVPRSLALVQRLQDVDCSSTGPSVVLRKVV